MLDNKIINEVIKTLPIGYYFKKSIPVEVVDNINCSYISFQDFKIRISSNQLKQVKMDTSNPQEVENNIRCVLYHELSHAILTPLTMFDSWITQTYHDIINVFEDERIESLLRSFYINVDFRKFIKKVNNYNEQERPTNAFNYYYYIVRFNDSPDHPELIDEKNELIKKYKDINFNSKYNYYTGADPVGDYLKEVLHFYKKCESLFQQQQQQQQESQQGDASSETDQQQEQEQEQEQEQDQQQQQQQQESDLLSDEEKNGLLKGFQKAFKNNTASAHPETMVDDFKTLIKKHNKEGMLEGCAYSYTGRVDPRRYAQKQLNNYNDYRIFKSTRENATEQGRAGVNFNLFIDTSGSFEPNEGMVNKILGALEKLEKINKNFTFNVIEVDMDVKLLQKSKRQIHCTPYGTYLNDRLEEVYKLVNKNKKNANYNIILFDGKVTNSDYQDQHFKTFNNKNDLIIYEKSNRRAIKQYAPNARKIMTTNYTEELYNSILTLLDEALR